MTVELLEEALHNRSSELRALGATVRFDADGASIVVDATKKPVSISRSGAAADCTIIGSSDDLIAIHNGGLNPILALSQGKIRVARQAGGPDAMQIARLLGALVQRHPLKT